MDATHVASFGTLSYVHVCMVICSGLFTTARTGEAYKDVVQHLFAAFALLGMPKHIKNDNDNGPACTSKAFQDFCLKFYVKHTTGIPYNPQGQAIMERLNQSLKNANTKITGETFKYLSPPHLLHHALFVLNYLNKDSEGYSNIKKKQH